MLIISAQNNGIVFQPNIILQEHQYQKQMLADIHFMKLIDYCLYDHTTRRAVLNMSTNTLISTTQSYLLMLREVSLQKYDCQRNNLFIPRLEK